MQNKFDRRGWLKLIPALAAAAPAGLAQAPEPPDRVTREALHQALTLSGLQFTEEQERIMLQGLNRNLVSYENLRKIDVPLDTEPATRFYPTAPNVTGGKYQPSRVRAGQRPTNLEDLAFAPVTEIAPLLKAKRITSVDLTKMYLARLKRYAPQLNCVITLTEDLALEQAAAVDAEIRRGKYRGPLHGVPCGVKDLFATKGIKTTWGAEPFQNQVPTYDSAVVERLQKTGSPLLAKLSMGALAQGGLWFGGMTKTPWNLEQTSSGSSAGSASATSAGLVGFSVGTETLGSIVSPATRCGVVGLRPTYGRVSRHGAMGLSWTMDKIGPICRSVEDCALVLEALRGTDGRDLAVVDAPFEWQPKLGIKGLRIGIVQGEFDRLRDEPQKKVYEQAIADLKAAGGDLKPVEFPKFDFAPLRIILSAEAAAAFDDLTRDGGVEQLKGQAPNDWPNTFRTSRMIPAVEYIRAQRARTLLMQEMDKFMADWDVLVTPSFSAGLTITNLTGHPQVAVPCGFVNGLPSSVVFTGRLYREGTPLRVALAYERATKWHTMHPKVDWSS